LSENASEPISVAVYVCTHQRNDALRSMLAALGAAADHAAPHASVAVVVVDDNPDGGARPVVDEFSARFPLGIHYRHSGKQNISIARNLGLDTAAELGTWVAMTDDDCEPSPEWISAYLDTQRRTGADALTGPLVMRFPDGSPRWLTAEPFALGENDLHDDGEKMTVAQTHNSMISAAWLRDHPDIRFEPALGRLGGEDMVFYRRNVAAGMRINYARDAVVYEVVGPQRATLRHQLRQQYWLGNSEYVTNTESGDATRGRMVLRSGRRLARAVPRPFLRLARREAPQWRWTLALVLRSVGTFVGAAGVRVDHH
jgi:glycosyltransferase involved in cell wall biosynthesis